MYVKLSQEQQTAIMELEQIEILIEMYGHYLIQGPWREIDMKRISKMENAFYLLQDQFAAKKKRLNEAFYRGEAVAV